MSRIVWDEIGSRTYETGVSNVVLYPQESGGRYLTGVAWNGISNIDEQPTGSDANEFRADGVLYGVVRSNEDYRAQISAYTYPDEFEECDGYEELEGGIYLGQQDRKSFGLVYKTILGNDTENESHGYKLHIVYGASASVADKLYNTLNDSPEAIEFTWDVSTFPYYLPGHKPFAHLVFKSTKTDPAKLTKLENILFGTDEKDARLPYPDEIIRLFQNE